MADESNPASGGLSRDLAERRFAALYREHGRSILAYALRRAEVEDAADITAETFLIAWRRLDDVPDGDRARPWLYAVAARVRANQRRGELRRLQALERLRWELREQAGGLELPGSERVPVLEALAGLEDTDRELLLLSGWEELPPRQIAQVLGISSLAVRARLHRARAKLRQALERQAETLDAGPPSVRCEEAR